MTINLNAELPPKFTLSTSQPSRTLSLAITPQCGTTTNVAITPARPFTLAVGAGSTVNAGSSGSTGTVDVAVTAQEALGIYRAVTILGFLCDPTNADLGAYAGVTRSSIPLGISANVVKEGLLTEATWTWTVNTPIFVGANGVLTQTAPALPLRRIGYAVSATQINLDPFPTIGV